MYPLIIYPLAPSDTFLIVQSDLGDYEDNGSSSSRSVSNIYLYLFLTRFVIVFWIQISTNMVRAPVRAPPILVYIGSPTVPCLLLRFDFNLDCNDHLVFRFLIGETL